MRRRYAWLLLGPSVALLAGLAIYPTIYLLRLSVSQQYLTKPWIPVAFVGLANLKQFFADSYLARAILVTSVFTALSLAFELVLGLALAYLLSRPLPLAGLVRPIITLPVMVMPVVAGLTWRLILNDSYGPLNRLLAVLHLPPQIWLGTKWALPSIVLVEVWQWMPFSALVFYVGLRSVPAELWEASAVDGAGKARTFFSIILPNLRWCAVTIALFRIADLFKAFDKIYVLTGGGPGTQTLTASLYVYKKAFVDFDMGYSSALAMLMLVLATIILLPLARRMKGGAQRA